MASINHLRANAWDLFDLTSTGTWYVAPPTLLDLTSRFGRTLLTAVLKIFINGDSISENDLILKGSVIDMEVGNGLGNQVFEAPDLVNLDLEEARFTIIGSGLRLGNIIYQDSGFYFNKTIDEEGNDIYEKSYVDPGKVFKQSPSKSTRVRIGRRINLWIVSKPEDEVN